MKLKNVELKPCPICGGKAELKQRKINGIAIVGATSCETKRGKYIRCSKCHFKTLLVSKIETAINLWNFRL